MRTVELNIDMEKIHHPEVKELSYTIGYLSTWALERFPIVKIYNDMIDDLTAYYYKEGKEKPAYVIGAVWRESSKEYTFHS